MRQGLALTVLLLLASVVSLVSSDGEGIIVQEKQGSYRVMARFIVAQAPDQVLNVLTDYERIPAYMPDVKVSIVRTRSPGQALVEQEAEGRVMMFSKRLYLLLDIREKPDQLTFVDTSGRSFSNYQGSWQVMGTDAGTAVSYQLDARPAFDVPKFVLMRLMRRDARQQIEHLRTEITTRARAAS